MALIPQLVVLVVLLMFSALFSGSEAAIFSLSKIQKKRLNTKHPHTWKTISSLLERPRRTLITILIGNMVVNTMATVLVTMIAVHGLGPSGVGWTIAFFTLILVITGELTPKIFAVRHNEWVAYVCAVPLNWLAKFLFPFRRLIRFVTDWVLSFLVHEKQGNADLVSESELKALARIGEEEGVLSSDEGEMIQNLINLGDRLVREIMTPRIDIVAFNIEEGRERLVGLIQQYHFSYFPVYEKTMDHLLGVISTQEFMLDTQGRLRELVQTPYFIPETKLIDELLHEFQKTGGRVAICVDEYGGTAGLVTLEDILEEIFGEFYDEYTKAEPLIKQIGDALYSVSGKANLHEINDTLSVTLHSEASETLSGWLLEQWGKIPKQNETFHWEGIDFTIKEVDRQRIVKVEIRKRR